MFSSLGVLFVGNWLYSARANSSKRQASFLKRRTKMMVIDLDGNRISFRRASLRHFAKYLTCVTIIGWFFALFSKRRQTLHDMIAGTVVLRRP